MLSVSRERAPLNIFLLGGCDIYGPLEPLLRAGERIRRAPYGHIPFTYTFGEMFQAIGVLRGERKVPDEIRPLCFMDSDYGPVPRAADFGDVDVFLIEFGSTVDMIFRGCCLNRLPLSSIVLQPLRQIGKDASKLANHWLRSEIMGQDAGKRLELAEQLISMMPDNLENADFIRSVLLESSAEKIDVLPALEKLRTLLNRPVGLVNYIFRYLPDGRAVSWPAGMQDEILGAAKSLDIPVFDPAPLVKEFGAEAALLPELSHYSDAFNPLIADKLLAFALAVAEGDDAISRAHSRARHV
jgi:hypothetical protein